jgi:hypothetical protein
MVAMRASLSQQSMVFEEQSHPTLQLIFYAEFAKSGFTLNH